MTTFDYILLAVAIAVLVYQISLLIRARREIILPGKPPSRGAVAVILAVVLVVAVIRTENLARTWPVFVIVFVACLAIFAGGCGLSANGMFGKLLAIIAFGLWRHGCGITHRKAPKKLIVGFL